MTKAFKSLAFHLLKVQQITLIDLKEVPNKTIHLERRQKSDE